MCYGVKARTEMGIRIARSRGDMVLVEKLQKLLLPFPDLDHHFANAFTHPRLVVFTADAPGEPQLAQWGLVPAWVKDNDQRKTIWNQTLNARGETIFEKPAFRASATMKRCIVHVEGFFEHHHFGKRAYPYFIRLKDREQFALAGLWEVWTDPDSHEALHTFSIVTTQANDLMRRIHNKPAGGPAKGATEPRMPVILTEEEERLWLAPIHGAADQQALLQLIKPYPTDAMIAHSVRPLLGKDGGGNTPTASEEFIYPELLLADPLQ